MSSIIIPVIIVSVIGLILGAVLVIASKVMAVKVDERIPAVRECLPGANCGACGFPGCDGYAKALVENPDLDITLCVPGAAAAAEGIGKVLGRSGGEVIKKYAYVKCNGCPENTKTKLDYKGIESCAAAKLMFGGNGSCTFGCIGMGDCEKVCPNEAIWIENGTAHVYEPLCTGCGLCSKTCPNGVISVLPAAAKILVDCSNKDKGANTRKNCTVGCIGCHLCEKNCPEGAVTVVDNLATIDYTKCTGCGKCTTVCKPGCIKPVGHAPENA